VGSGLEVIRQGRAYTLTYTLLHMQNLFSSRTSNPFPALPGLRALSFQSWSCVPSSRRQRPPEHTSLRTRTPPRPSSEWFAAGQRGEEQQEEGREGVYTSSPLTASFALTLRCIHPPCRTKNNLRLPAPSLPESSLPGPRSIEHGNYLDDASAKAMAEHKAFLVPTIVRTGLLGGAREGFSSRTKRKQDEEEAEEEQAMKGRSYAWERPKVEPAGQLFCP
jgi:hypothetical protein